MSVELNDNGNTGNSNFFYKLLVLEEYIQYIILSVVGLCICLCIITVFFCGYYANGKNRKQYKLTKGTAAAKKTTTDAISESQRDSLDPVASKGIITAQRICSASNITPGTPSDSGIATIPHADLDFANFSNFSNFSNSQFLHREILTGLSIDVNATPKPRVESGKNVNTLSIGSGEGIISAKSSVDVVEGNSDETFGTRGAVNAIGAAVATDECARKKRGGSKGERMYEIKIKK